MNERVSSRVDISTLQSLMDAPASAGTPSAYQTRLKRLLDVVLVLVATLPAIAILLPFMALIALDGRSPIYSQLRVGRGGRHFRMYKLRTMLPNADQILEHHLERDSAARQEWDEKQKLTNDPRITLLGVLLRKTSLDELPQLWNVLCGDMSVVGPRPMMVNQKELYPGRAYYEMRPGITGFWQISERNETSFAQRSEYDAAYYAEMSFKTDLWVIASTVRVVLKGTGC